MSISRPTRVVPSGLTTPVLTRRRRTSGLTSCQAVSAARRGWLVSARRASRQRCGRMGHGISASRDEEIADARSGLREALGNQCDPLALGRNEPSPYNRGMTSLEGQFLVAMPDMEDERFAESVILLVGHGEEGAMGLVVNHELENLRFADILDDLDLGDPDAVIRLPDAIRQRAVMRGGPVERGRGFVLHTADYHSGNTYKVTEEIG